MRPLVAIISCHNMLFRRNSQRATWLSGQLPEGFDYRFFLGRGPSTAKPKDDEVFLDVDDSYAGLILKIKAILRWALENGYETVFKTDDDVYVRPERLLAAGRGSHDYVGRLRGPSGGFPAPYASGLGYWLSRKAMEVLIRAPQGKHDAEDRWVGNVLREAGISCWADYRYAVIFSARNAVSDWEGPRVGNQLIAVCEFDQEEMSRIHREFLTLPAADKKKRACGRLSNVCIMVKTFLRDGMLRRAVKGIRENLPECKIIIVDDGVETREKITWYAELRAEGHACIWLPFDSGFGEKANAAIPHMDREYVLIGADDFEFRKPGVREGIVKMVTVLEGDSGVALASGRVNNRPYESVLNCGPSWVSEQVGYRGKEKEVNGVRYWMCDLTVNYSLVRSRIFRSSTNPDGICWDGGEVKIGGGEHGAFFMDMKKANLGVAYVPGVNIDELAWDPTLVHPKYAAARGRARLPGRAHLRKRGILNWQLMDGTWEDC